ncbi:hypothetical protein JW905_13435 [bacterium]|nr:hypothetical protein [candidate division CSSED10-310 bacterium]
MRWLILPLLALGCTICLAGSPRPLPLLPEVILQPGLGGLTQDGDTRYLAAEQSIQYRVTWRRTGMIEDASFTPRVFVHLVNRNGHLVTADDHDLPQTVMHTSNTVSYTRFIKAPAAHKARRLSLRIGLYQGKGGDRIPLLDGDQPIPYVETGPLYLHGGREIIFFSGWHQPDLLENGKLIRWMSGRGECSFRTPRSSCFLAFQVGSSATCLRQPLQVAIDLNGVHLAELEVPSDGAAFTLPMEEDRFGSEPWCRLTLTANQDFIPRDCLPSSEDERRLALFVSEMKLVDIRFETGWHGEECNGGDCWRWSTGLAEVACFNPNVDATLLLVASTSRECMTFPLPVQILLNDEPLADLTMTGAQLYAAVPVSRAEFGPEQTTRFSIAVARTFQPAACSGGDDQRELGIMVRQLELLTKPPEAPR